MRRSSLEGNDMKKLWFIGLPVLGLMLTLSPKSLFSQANPAQSQPAPVGTERASGYWGKFKFEVATSVSYSLSMLDSSYAHHYSPPFLSGAYESTGDHTIKIVGDDGWGFNISAGYYLQRNLGVQVLVDYAKPKISGGNTGYDVWLNYSSSYEDTPPYPNTYEYTYGWPPTAGDLTEICISLDAIFRLPISRKLAFNLSGGLTYFHVKGEGTGIAYSYYWLEDGWFWGRTFNVKTKIGEIDKLGFNLGAELNCVLWSNMCLILDARCFACPSSTLPMKVIDEGLVTPPPPPFEEITFEEVEATLNLQDITINPSFFRINLGLKYMF
jgi:hypothetical protein